MSGALTLLVLHAISLKAQPAALTVGQGSGAEVEISGVEGSAPPKLSASAGEVSAPVSLGGGRYKARYLLPREKFPQVVILLAESGGEGKHTFTWLTVPISAPAKLTIETKPRATVNVMIATKSYGPLTADARGRVNLSAVVPPGIDEADVEAVDRAQNKTNKKLDLNPRPYPLVRAASARPEVAVVGGEAVAIDLFAMEKDGSPLKDAARLRVSAQSGTADPPAAAQSGGVFTVQYHPPSKIGSGTDTITAALDGTPSTASVKIVLHPGPPVGAVVELKPSTYVAGTKQRIQVHATSVDANGNEVPSSPPLLSAPDLGQLQGSDWILPDAFEGHSEAHLRAGVGGASGEGRLLLQAAIPSKAELQLPRGYARAGEPIKGQLTLHDEFGNAVEHAAPTVTSASGHTADVQEMGQGQYTLSYVPGPDEPAGALTFAVASGGVAIAQGTGPQMLPYWRAWAFSAGLFLAGQTNGGSATGFSPRITLGLRIGQSAFEALAEGGVTLYAHYNGAPALDASGNDLPPVQGKQVLMQGDMLAESGMGGLRFTFPVGVRTALHVEGLVGLQATQVTTCLSGSPCDSTATFPGNYPGEKSTALAVRLGGGLTYWLGTNRLVLQFEYLRVRADPSYLLHISGGLGGFSIALGYLYSF